MCVCVCVPDGICALVRAAVSTARIGMSGMIGIEFFKNAFSPGAAVEVGTRRAVSAGALM